jgi:hypothetical protein
MGSSSAKPVNTPVNVTAVEQKTEDPLKDNIFLKKVREQLDLAGIKYDYNYSCQPVTDGIVHLNSSLYGTKQLQYPFDNINNPIKSCRGLFYNGITPALKSELNTYYDTNNAFIIDKIFEIYRECMVELYNSIKTYLLQNFNVIDSARNNLRVNLDLFTKYSDFVEEQKDIFAHDKDRKVVSLSPHLSRNTF